MQTEQIREANRISKGMVLLLAAACGLIVANLYYAQTLVGQIGASTGLSSAAAGIIVTITQIGYVAGLLFIVPVSDLTENRRLVTLSLTALIGALLAAAFAPNAPVFLAASLLIGLGSVVAQILVPFATYLASEEQRGRVVGSVMSGLLLGIMFARPLASFIASAWRWQAVFAMSAILVAVLAILLARLLPQRRPSSSARYRELIVSLGGAVQGYARSAAPGVLSSLLVRGVQPLLDGDPHAVDRPLRNVPAGHRLVRFSRRGGRRRGAYRRQTGG